jgi:aminoglycoside phosphotransferase (APT) family kinase protein
MAATPSPRSEVPCRAALARFLARESGAQTVAVAPPALLRGGAIRRHWAIDAHFSGGALAGRQSLVLCAGGPARFVESLPPAGEFAVLKAVFAAGIRVPEPLFAGIDVAVCGRPFLVMRRVAGSADPAAITGGDTLPALAEELGRQLARLHKVQPPRRDLAFLTHDDPAGRIAAFRAYLDRHPQPRPVLEWGMRWLETHLPDPVAPALCHRDFRTGNYLVAAGALAAILDWEFAGWSDPYEDIGWFCCKAWRFARLDREAGGIAARQSFYRGYEGASGRRIDPARVHFWEVFANVRWAVIALQQSDRYMLGGERNLDLALTGRRATESEFEILMLLDPASPTRAQLAPAAEPVHKGPDMLRSGHDLPDGLQLLALARAVLAGELIPLLPPDRQAEARHVARAMAIAEREAKATDAPFQAILRELAAFYADSSGSPLTHPAPGSSPGQALRAGSPFSRNAGEGAEPRQKPGEAGEGKAGNALLLWRFAGDLRIGAFATTPQRERAARTLLWRLMQAKLRLGNPQFLSAHGFA